MKDALRVNNLRATFPNDGERRANKPLEIAHSNIFGRMRDIFFIDDTTSSGNDVEKCPNGRNEVPMLVGMANFFRSPSFDFEKCKERVGDNLVAIQAPIVGPPNKGCSSTPPS